ncbi:MAG: hypothetical protein ACFFDP_05495 [Promethearchaeota archaeon]
MSINDTTNFAISKAGVIFNAKVLEISVYSLHVTVRDVVGDEITGDLSVTVESPTTPSIPPPIPGFPIEAVVLSVAIAVSFSVITCRRRKP